MNNGKHLIKHGKSGSKIYHIWSRLKQRCLKYKELGGICEEWLEFENFYKDMGEPPDKKSKVKQIDSNKNFCKENCFWDNTGNLNTNPRYNHFITYNGTTKCISEWARYKNLTHNIISNRIKKGWGIKEILEIPRLRNHNRINKLKAIKRIKQIQNGDGDRFSEFPDLLKGNLAKNIAENKNPELKDHDITFNYGFEYGEIYGLMKAFDIKPEEII